MKIKKLLRAMLGAVILFSLLIMAIPALPAQAATYQTDLDIAEGPVGTEVTITGEDFYYSSTLTCYVTIYFSSQSVTLPGKTIDTSVTTYAAVAGYDADIIVEADGVFSATFTVPSELTDGTVDLASVTEDDYYIYITETIETDDWNGITSTIIRSKDSFTVTGSSAGEITLDQDDGYVGDEVEITGEGFADTEDISVEYDSSTLAIYDGDEETDSSGDFVCYVIIPDSTAGSHTITVTDGSSEAEADFTVKPAITLSDSSVTAGDSITVSGTGFGRSKVVTLTLGTGTTTATANTKGTFTEAELEIPTDLAAGTYELVAEDTSDNIATTSLTVGGTATTTPATTTTITLSAASAAPGESVTVSGTGFTAGSVVTISIGGASAAATADASGAFSGATLAIPATLALGTYNVTASDTGNRYAVARLTVQAAGTTPTTPATGGELTLSLSQTTGSVGAYIMVGGAGFQPNAAVLIKYDDAQVATATVQAGGAFVSGIFQVPVSKAGSHNITATDGLHTGLATFTVAAATLAAPAIQSPAKLGKASAPAIFTWGAITAESAPVTYTLQIATDGQFTTDSLVLNKTGLSTTTYTLTDAEQAKLNASAASLYYWRVQATDAAQNTSDWSAASEFYASVPFKFVESPYFYASIGVGAVLLFLIGFLIGRRTAFYY
jgi:hypothetical protein